MDSSEYLAYVDVIGILAGAVILVSYAYAASKIEKWIKRK